MSGRKGRCAHCGAVNMVPVVVPDVLTVEVKRATAVAVATPFRDADHSVRGTIQATVALSQSRILSDAPITDGGQPRDFFDHVASRLTDYGEEFGTDRAAPGQNRARVGMVEEMPVELPPARAKVGGAAAAVAPAAVEAEPRSAVAVALGIGVGIGFCVGIVIGKWLM
jgi:hypothetical protein